MRRIGTGLIWVGFACVVQLVLLYYYWTFTDEWPRFVQGRPIEGVIVPLGITAVCGLLFGAMFRDIGGD